MKCTVCNEEFESKRKDAKYCSPKCRKKAFKNGTDKEDLISNGTDKSPQPTGGYQGTDNSVTDNIPGLPGLPELLEIDPLKRITYPKEVAFCEDGFYYRGQHFEGSYYKSQIYENLLEELNVKSVEQLVDEDYWIPAWKLNGIRGEKLKSIMMGKYGSHHE